MFAKQSTSSIIINRAFDSAVVYKWQCRVIFFFCLKKLENLLGELIRLSLKL